MIGKSVGTHLYNSLFEALTMWYESEGDRLRLGLAFQHLQLIDYFQRLNTGFPGDSEIPERGGSR